MKMQKKISTRYELQEISLFVDFCLFILLVNQKLV